MRSAPLDRIHIPGALIDPKGAVPDRTRGSGHMAPTYVVGSRDRKNPSVAVDRTFHILLASFGSGAPSLYSIRPIFMARATASIVVLANNFLRAEAR